MSRIVPAASALLLLAALACACAGGPARRPAPAPQPVPAPRTDESGVWHVVQPGETLWRIAHTYEVPLERLAEVNGISDPARIRAGRRILIPDATERREIAPPAAPAVAEWRWPAEGPLTSLFGVPRRGGRRHQGIDIAVASGSPVRAARAGRVVFAGRRGGYGLLVIVEHPGGFASWYAHNRRLLVRPGEPVAQGEVVARSGASGNARGEHLHFEVRYRGRAIDPLPLLSARAR
jgi:LysM repeat protein